MELVKSLIRHVLCLLLHRSGINSLYIRWRRRSGVRILTYHRVNDSPDSLGLSIRAGHFLKQMALLKRQHRVASLQDGVEVLRGSPSGGGCVVVTFDDGFRDNLTEAYPILRRLGVPFTVFITTGGIDRGFLDWHLLDETIRKSTAAELDLRDQGLGLQHLGDRGLKEECISILHRELKHLPHSRFQEISDVILERAGSRPKIDRLMLDWDEVRRLAGDELVTIGSHTLSHPILTRLSRDEALREIRESKARLEKETGRRTDHLAYPNGGKDDFNEEIVAMVAESGYSCACTTIPGFNHAGDNLYGLKRMDVTPAICRNVFGGFSESVFAVKVSGMLDGILFRY